MPTDQVITILIAAVVAALALGLLTAIALLARRRDGNRGGEARPPTVEATPSTARASWPSPAPAVEGTPERPVAPMPEAAASVPEAAAPGLEPAAPLAVAAAAERPSERSPAAPAATAGTAAYEADAGRRFAYDQRAHDPHAERAIESFLGMAPGRAPVEGPSPDPYLDQLTGLDTLLAWERDLAEEDARYARYRRPVTVVVVELDGLARLVERFGEEPARRILPAVGDTMRRYARRTDRVAHAGGGRFLVLMPETDEIQAINYVERIRAASERWLEAGAVALHLSIGWASPTAVGQLDTALRAAEERMTADRRRARRPEVDPAR